MQLAVRLGASYVVASTAFLAATAPVAAAAPKPITGKLSEPGYTVIALAASGKATSARADTGVFRLRPPASTVTLQLRAKNGTYAGPIVVGRTRTRAIMGVRAGARLGGILVRGGYANVAKRLPSKWVDVARRARARNGVPIGAGNFGRVRSKPVRGAVKGDLDLDGIPDPLDIDDNGNLILDNLDRPTAGRGARSAQAALPGLPGGFGFSSNLALDLPGTVNVNAGSTVEQINSALASSGLLNLSTGPGAELDCGGQPDPANPDGWSGGLRYCTRGGTGSAGAAPFPGPPGASFDPDGDGFGTLTTCPGCQPSLFLHHGATTDQIATGDVLILCLPGCRETGGSEFPATLQFVFATVPALVSYSDGAGHSATVNYPLSLAPPGPGGSPPGGGGNGFPVAPCPTDAPAPCVAGDVVLTLTFWRPQRSRIANDPAPQPAESDAWTEIGGLTYGATPSAAQGNRECPQNAFSTTDPQLAPAPTVLPPNVPHPGLRDTAGDRPSALGHTFTYTLDLSQCLAADGASFDPGQEVPLAFFGSHGGGMGGDFAQQNVVFKRQ